MTIRKKGELAFFKTMSSVTLGQSHRTTPYNRKMFLFTKKNICFSKTTFVRIVIKKTLSNFVFQLVLCHGAKYASRLSLGPARRILFFVPPRWL